MPPESSVYSPPVKRSAVIFLLLLAMGWQALAMAKGGATVNALLDFGHAVLHWDGTAHHHHADGSLTLDASDESTRHLLADHSSGPFLTAQDPATPLPALQLALAACAGQPCGPPYLDGPLRPPRLSA